MTAWKKLVDHSVSPVIASRVGRNDGEADFERTSTSIRVSSGEYVDLLNPVPDMIYLWDIGYALARLPRYTAHAAGRYPVGQHLLRASYMAHPGDWRLAWELLMHDATEAYVTDVSRPLKATLRVEDGPETSVYDRVERRVRSAIAAKYLMKSTEPDRVKFYDSRLGDHERTFVFDDESEADPLTVQLCFFARAYDLAPNAHIAAEALECFRETARLRYNAIQDVAQ